MMFKCLPKYSESCSHGKGMVGSWQNEWGTSHMLCKLAISRHHPICHPHLDVHQVIHTDSPQLLEGGPQLIPNRLEEGTDCIAFLDRHRPPVTLQCVRSIAGTTCDVCVGDKRVLSRSLVKHEMTLDFTPVHPPHLSVPVGVGDL